VPCESGGEFLDEAVRELVGRGLGGDDGLIVEHVGVLGQAVGDTGGAQQVNVRILPTGRTGTCSSGMIFVASSRSKSNLNSSASATSCTPSSHSGYWPDSMASSGKRHKCGPIHQVGVAYHL
jgi:hypothetical protein